MNGEIDTEGEVFMAMGSSLVLFSGDFFNGVILLLQFEASGKSFRSTKSSDEMELSSIVFSCS